MIWSNQITFLIQPSINVKLKRVLIDCSVVCCVESIDEHLSVGWDLQQTEGYMQTVHGGLGFQSLCLGTPAFII